MRFCAETDDMAELATGANPNGSGSPSPRSAKGLGRVKTLVFTQPGSKTVLTPLKWDVCVTPDSDQTADTAREVRFVPEEHSSLLQLADLIG